MRKILHILLMVSLLYACKKEKFQIENLNGGIIEILGHGGSGYADLYPIDTKESVYNSLSAGADGSEIDIQLTKDNVLVLFHDEDLSSNTNKSGSIRDLTWAEVQEATYISTPYSGYKIPSLREIIMETSETGNYRFSLDIKLFAGEGETVDQYFLDFITSLKAIYDEFSLHERVYIEAQSELFLSTLQQADPDMLLFIYPQVFESGFTIATNLNLYGISISTDVVSEEQVQLAHNAGLRVIIWNVKTKAEHKEAIRKNPDIIESDNIDYLVSLLK